MKKKKNDKMAELLVKTTALCLVWILSIVCGSAQIVPNIIWGTISTISSFWFWFCFGRYVAMWEALNKNGKK